ncbi:GntR family transcriptional regulator [Demequina sp. NBRC 110051]|uniref:GntR family transcriptional regulator n=1 Tax=Demequina sp. NBRC 110051 TaxID=1570340 RepID=UPI0009FEE5A3|nr:GntR family transcriptional regulator [Demequina sp. NBRC 110051]
MAVKYMDVYQRIKADITSGKFSAGDYLPTEPELMADYEVSRTTVRKAIAMLRDDGYVAARQGRGTEVLVPDRQENSTYPFTSLLGHTTVESRLVADPTSSLAAQGATIETVPAAGQVADALGIPLGTPVFRVQRLKIAGDQPAAHIASYLEARRFPGLDEYSGQIHYLYEFLAEHYAVRFRRSQSRMRAVAADFIESRVLDVPVGSPLIMHERVTESEEGPIEYAESFERSELVATVVTVAPATDAQEPFLAYEP